MRVDIDKVGNRIFLVSSYRTPGLGKVVAGAAFSKEGGPHWSIPLTLDACHALRAKFGNQLRVGRDLSAWARTEIARQEAMGALGRADDAELLRVPEVSPGLAKAMASRTYQRVGARFLAAGRSVLIADQPGLGKTLEAIGGIIEAGVQGPYLVICPKTAVETVWAQEIPRWWPGQRVLTVPDGRAKRDEILTQFITMHDDAPLSTKFGEATRARTWVVVHPRMVATKSFWLCPVPGCDDPRTPVKAGRKELQCAHAFEVQPKHVEREDVHEFPQLFAVEWGAIIVDESQEVLIRRNGVPTQVRNGAELLRNRESDEEEWCRVALSGTPMRGKAQLLWGTLNWLRPKRYSAFWRWAETNFEVESGYGGSRTIGKMREDKREQLYKDLDTIMLRRTKAEVAKDLPPKNYMGSWLDGIEFGTPGVWLPMDPGQKRFYEAMAAQSMVAMEGGTLNAIGILAEMTRLKQFATSAGTFKGEQFRPALPSNKFEYLVELLTELGFPDDPETKVIVVSQFTQVLQMMAEVLRTKHRIDSYMLTGNEVGHVRKRIIANFNQVNDPCNVMFLQVKTGGVAITVDTADHMVFLDETWVPDDQEQAEDRIHRVSKPRPVFYHYLRSLGTIEESIARTNAERAAETGELLDGRRGIEYAKRVMEAMR